MLAAGLLLASHTQAWYGPFGTPITEYAYKVCHEQVWPIASIGIYGDIPKIIEICAYYDESGELLGFSMAIVN